MVASEWEQSRSWDGSPAPTPQPAPVEKPVPTRITIVDAIKVFLSNREAAKIAPATLRKYRTFTTQLTAFADACGYVMLDQFTSADIDVFYGKWNLGATREKQVPRNAEGVSRFCMNRKWLAENPVSTDINQVVANILLDEAVAVMAADDGIGQIDIFNHGLQFAVILPSDFSAEDDRYFVRLGKGSIGLQ